MKYISTLVFVTCLMMCHGLEDCGSKVGKPTKVTVTGCGDLDQRCILRRNTNVTLTMEFNLEKEATEVKAQVYGVVLEVPIPFAIPNPDGCTDSGLTCPLKTGGPYNYVATMPIEKKYPKVTVDVKWELKNQDGDNIICVLIPAKIQ